MYKYLYVYYTCQTFDPDACEEDEEEGGRGEGEGEEGEEDEDMEVTDVDEYSPACLMKRTVQITGTGIQCTCIYIPYSGKIWRCLYLAKCLFFDIDFFQLAVPALQAACTHTVTVVVVLIWRFSLEIANLPK